VRRRSPRSYVSVELPAGVPLELIVASDLEQPLEEGLR